MTTVRVRSSGASSGRNAVLSLDVPSTATWPRTAVMPPGVPPIRLFRTFAINLPMTAAMRSWGSYELSRNVSLTMRQREIVIDRTCARCRCQYEWGVHMRFFADRAGLTADQIGSLTHGGATDRCWTDPAETALINAVDALHDHATVSDDLWQHLAGRFNHAQLLDLFLLCGWYHAISFAANASRIDREDHAPRFDDCCRSAGPTSESSRGRQPRACYSYIPPAGTSDGGQSDGRRATSTSLTELPTPWPTSLPYCPPWTRRGGAAASAPRTRLILIN